MMKSKFDKFYTKEKIVKQCLATLPSDKTFDLWVEPSAGAGAFLFNLPEPRIGLDIAPDHDEIINQDFLQWRFPENKSIAVVGNPPFGRQCSLALKFFKRSSLFADLIAFILPRTFKKVSIQNKLSTKWDLQYELDLPATSFELINDYGSIKNYSVSCVWQIWERIPDGGRRKKIKIEQNHSDWEWTTKDKAKFCMRRTGGSAGKMYKDFDKYAVEGNYFINCSDEVYEKLDSLYDKFQKVAYDTVSNPSLSKGEIVYLYKKLLASS